MLGKKRRNLLMCGVVLWSLVTLPVFAQMSNSVQLNAAAPGKDGGMIGIAVVSMPQYQGSSGRWNLAVPVIDYQWSSGWFAGVSSGIGYNFSESPNAEYGVRLTANLGRREKRAKLLRGMGDIKESAEVGAFFNYRLTPNLGINHTVSYGAGYQHRGALFHLEASFSEVIDSRMRAGASVGASYANAHYMQDFFGVTSAQSSRTSMAPYLVGAGLKDTYVSGFISYMLSDRTALSLSVSSERLASGAKASPLSKNVRSSSMIAALTYHF